MVAVAVLPVGRRNNLDERVVVSSKGSCGAPAVEVAPVSLTADAMVRFMIPHLSAVVDMGGLVVVCCELMHRRILCDCLSRHALLSVYWC